MPTQPWKSWRPGARPWMPELPRVIGHRGAKGTSPENTLVSIREAHALGARWIELDAKLTRDGVPILMHDALLDRTTDGEGPVAQADLTTIRRLDAGAWMDERFRGTTVPTLRETLELLLELGMGVNVEIKACPGREAETASASVEVIREVWPKDAPPVLISSFAIASLEAAYAAAPGLPRGYLVEALPHDWAQTMLRLECTTLNAGHRHMTLEQLRELVAVDLPVLFYTVNDPARAGELLAAGAASIITDLPAAILPVAG